MKPKISLLLAVMVILSLASALAATGTVDVNVEESQVKSLLLITENNVNTLKNRGVDVPRELVDHIDRAKKLIEARKHSEAYQELLEVMDTLKKLIQPLALSPREASEIEKRYVVGIITSLLKRLEKANVPEDIKNQVRELMDKVVKEPIPANVMASIRNLIHMKLNMIALENVREKISEMLWKKLAEFKGPKGLLTLLREDIVEPIEQEIKEWLSKPIDIEKGIILAKHYGHLARIIKPALIHVEFAHKAMLGAWNARLKGFSEALQHLNRLEPMLKDEKAKEIIEKLKEAINYTRNGINELKEAINCLVKGDVDEAKKHALTAKEYANMSDNILENINTTDLKPQVKRVIEIIVKLIHRVNDGIRHIANLVIKYADKLLEKPPIGAKVRLAGVIIGKEESNETVKLVVRGLGVARYENKTYIRIGEWILLINKTSTKVKVVGKGNVTRVIAFGEVTGYSDDKPIVKGEQVLAIKCKKHRR